MPKKSYGETVEKRVKRLFEVLLDHVAHCQCEDNDWGVKLALGEEGKLLRVETNLAALVRLAEQKGEKLTKDQVRDAISHYLADYLGILRDERHENEKQGCEEWRFSLTLWAKYDDKTTNLTKFSEEWHKRRSEPSKKAIARPEKTAAPPVTVTALMDAKPQTEANLQLLTFDLTGKVEQLTRSEQYYAILTDIVTKKDILNDLYVSIGEGDFVYAWITRIFHEANLDKKPKISRLILKRLSDELIDIYISTNRLSINFKNKINRNLEFILEDEQLRQNNVEIEIKYWHTFPKFHGYLYGDDMLLGEWANDAKGYIHVKSPLYYTNRQFFPKQYDFIKNIFEENSTF
ncbi:MAG: hypothetical protein IM550_11540 [Microcystis sp. M54BS1]|nr:MULTISPECIES: hypothetical protein [unclassified Microcystis]MBE5228785.1 hypothetical protein [Microcystis aeruginosa PMC 728.11]MCA2539834.1 hypothetical protein [Microcystis sp. M54BS1]MCA2598326.1 hypothetical protein [Microcystis sp. M38BS1]MCA2611021.1 hypothetical protein [Microcystis sp. M27BS1]MCA2508036.1 hypothetical protein [Microcystis sp. M62BS1]